LNFGNFGNDVSLPIFKLQRPSLAQNKEQSKLHTAYPRRDMKSFQEKAKNAKK
jgi:hypothetical protein